MSIASASDFEIAPAPARPLAKPLLLAAGCVALADWLFYGWDVGVSLALFLAALGIMDFRTWRLQRYLANNPDLTQKPLDSGKG